MQTRHLARALALLAFAAGCASSPPLSTAVVTVGALTPPAGSQVQQSTVIEATVAFTIDKFQEQADTYYLVTQFQAADGTSFNHSPRLADHSILTAAKGSVLVSYPLARVWSDPRLKKPVRTPLSLLVYVDDVDAKVKRAVTAGARLDRPVENKFYGDRMGGIEDPFGHQWYVGTHIEDVTPEEMKKRMAAMGQS